MRATVFAMGGTALIAFASLIAALAPTDGQTGMCCCPLGLGGLVLLALAGDRVRLDESSKSERRIVLVMAAIAAACLLVSFIYVEPVTATSGVAP